MRDRGSSLPLFWVLALACGSDPAPEKPGPEPAAPAVASVDAPARGAEPQDPPAAELDAKRLQRVLDTHLRGGRVAYRALAGDYEARAALSGFLGSAASMPEDAPLSSWLNVYNAMVIQLVVERYPIDSVMDVPDFFKALKRPVAGEPRSLDEIEHGVIRERFHDARVHMALNCGAVSCPPLSPKVFREATLDSQLDALSRAAVRDPAHVELKDGTLHVSALFFWFAGDFERDAGSVKAWLGRYTESPIPGGVELVQREYDWALAQSGR